MSATLTRCLGENPSIDRVGEIREYFEANREHWTKIQTLVMGMGDDDAVMDLYRELPAPKKAKKPKKTDAEKDAERAEREEERKRNGQKRLWEAMMTEMGKPFKNEDHPDVDNHFVKETFGLLTSEEQKEIFKKMMEYRKRAGHEAVKNLFVKKKRLGDECGYKIDACRIRGEEDVIDEKRCGYSGKTFRKRSKDTGLPVTYKEIETKRLKGGVIHLDEGEALIWDMTRDGVRQAKKKEGWIDLKTPANEVVEGCCGVAVSLSQEKNIHKLDENGVWIPVKKDWGLFPCGTKCSAGSDMCKRHLNAKKELKMWERDMCKLCDSQIDYEVIDRTSEVETESVAGYESDESLTPSEKECEAELMETM